MSRKKNNKIVKNCNRVDLKILHKKKEVLTSFFLDSNYFPMTKKQIMAFLNVNKNEEFILDMVLDEIENDAICYLDDSKRYRVNSDNRFFSATYEWKCDKFGYAVSKDDNRVYIDSKNTLGAMTGDIVLVEILSGVGAEKQEGIINKIIKRNTKTLIARHIKNQNFGFARPVLQNNADIYICKKYSSKFKDGDIVEVEIEKYATKNSKAEGKIIKTVSSNVDPLNEVKALYRAYMLDKMEEFPKAVEEEIINIPSEVLEEDMEKRVDRTHGYNIFTIDSEDAKDLDDAVSLKDNGDGTYLLSVYIADVSHYVKPHTALDREAILRGTSIYIPGTVIPMLPKELSNGICSLNEGVKRLSLAVDMKIDGKSGEVVESNIFKAVIKVTKRMSYEKVYKVLNGKKDEVKDYLPYADDILLFEKLAKVLYAKRKKEGTIDFDVKETKIVLNNENMVEEVKPYEITFANKIIEEFMLVTNMVVAERFYMLQIPFIYRIHELPDEEKLRGLNEILNMYGKRIKNVKKVHSKNLSDILDSITDEKEKRVVSHSMLRSLKLARYSNECIGHFGLSAKYYCHFTSPIRRYPDLFIHRVISYCIENNYLLDENKYNAFLKQAEKYSDTSSDREKNATKIERAFVDLYKAIYMENFVGNTYHATVSSVTQFGMFVELENTVEGLVPFDNMPKNDYFEYDDIHKRLIGRNTKITYKIGDQVKVKLTRVDKRSRQIDFKVI